MKIGTKGGKIITIYVLSITKIIIITMNDKYMNRKRKQDYDKVKSIVYCRLGVANQRVKSNMNRSNTS